MVLTLRLSDFPSTELYRLPASCMSLYWPLKVIQKPSPWAGLEQLAVWVGNRAEQKEGD